MTGPSTCCAIPWATTCCNAQLSRIREFSTDGKLPRIFDHIFMCAPDVADDVFERGKPMERLPEMARTVTIYHNRGDLSMPVSDYTKGNTDRPRVGRAQSSGRSRRARPRGGLQPDRSGIRGTQLLPLRTGECRHSPVHRRRRAG